MARSTPPDAAEASLLKRRLFWLSVIYVFSGASALMYEVVWVRLLKLVLGNTVHAAGVVVAVFLGGLALGSILMGRRADRVRRPLRLYMTIEILIVISALLLPLALSQADKSYVWAYRAFPDSGWLLTVMQIAVSALILLVPTMLMGSTLPLLSRTVMKAQRSIGSGVGRLYAFNTLGAAAGTFLAGFVLLRAVGVWGTICVSAVLNLVVAFGAWRLSGNEVVEPAAEEEPGRAGGNAAALTPRWLKLLLAASFVSGFVSIGYELVWMRSVIHLMGADTYVFSAVLTMYLLGNMLGAWTAGRAVRENTKCVPWFGVTLGLLGLAGLLYLPVLAVWRSCYSNWLDHWLTGLLNSMHLPLTTAVPVVHAAVLFLVPSFLMGLGFPLALQAVHRAGQKVEVTTSRVYSLNTLGAVLGGLVAAFVLMPGRGVQGTMVVLGLAATASGVVLLSLSGGMRNRLVALGLVLAAAGCILRTPGDLFRREFVTYSDTELVDVTEGVTTTVSVHKTRDGDLWLCTSGIQVAGDRLQCVQRMLGHLGMLIHPDARDVLTIGFGSGETTRCLSLHEPERLDCVELARELTAMSLKHFKHRNLGDKLWQNVNMRFMDAKNYLHLTPRKYDLIMTDSISPKAFADNASLYTREYFETAKKRLKPGGLVVCWTPFNLPPSCFESVVGTFAEVFPQTTVWYPVMWRDHFVLLVGSDSPQVFAPEKLNRAIRQTGVQESLGGIRIFDAEDVLGCYLGDQDDLRAALAGFKVNSDYSPYVEFSPEDILPEEMKWQYFMKFTGLVRKNNLARHLDLSGFTPELKQQYQSEEKLRFDVDLLGLRIENPGEISITEKETDLLLEGLAKYLVKHPSYVRGYQIRGTLCLEKGQYAEAVKDLTAGLALEPLNGYALNTRGEAYLAQGLRAEAAADFRKAVEHHPAYLMPLLNLAGLLSADGRFSDAMAYAGKAVSLAPENPRAHFCRGAVYFRKGDFAKAAADFTRTIALNPRGGAAYAARAACSQKTGDFKQALEDINTCDRLRYPVDPELRLLSPPARQ